MKYKDYYAALGMPRDADAEQIRKAYATLKDPEKRAAYDELGRRPPDEEFAPPPQWSREHAWDGQSFEDIDLADLLASLGRGHRGSRRGPVPLQGRDYETVVRIGLEEAHRGTRLNLDLAREEGDGRTLEVTIPPGVSGGQKLRLRGKGGKGRDGGADGDIYLHITLSPHPVFRADHHDLYFDLALAPWEAALGADVEVPTLDGPVMLAVPPGTRSGRKLRLRGRGLANGRSGRGHLYAVIHVDVPATLTARERELFQELARTSHFNPRRRGQGEPA